MNVSITNNARKFASGGPNIPAKTAIYRMEIINNAIKMVETNRWLVSTTLYKHGIRMRVIVEAKTIPKLSDRAIGITN